MRNTENVAGSPTLGNWINAIKFSLNRSRFSIIVLIVGLGLLLTDQGRDALIAYVADEKSIRVSLAAAFWAFSIWGWSHLLLDVHYDDLPSCLSCYNQCRKWVPRLLGSFAFLVVAFSAYQAEQHVLVWWALGGFIIFIVLVVNRRPVERKLATHLQKSSRYSMKKIASALAKNDIGPDSIPPYESFLEMLGVPVSKNSAVREAWKFRALLTLAMFISFLILAALGIFAPVLLGNTTGSLILFFIWGATWLPLGSWLSYCADKQHVPLIFLLVVIALLSSYFNDNHEIRHPRQAVSVDTRPSVTEALAVWSDANKPHDKKIAVPFVVVATAGGGIRAAYWTATVLGDLHDNSNQFTHSTFALSGVSGGSVGAAVYRALLDVPPQQWMKNCPDGMVECAQRILGQDFLGPLTAAMLYPDLAQRFWPWVWFPDRAAALEQSWEQSFKKVTEVDGLSASISSLKARAGAPSLFLNATWDDNGRRIVGSNLRYAKNIADEVDSFILSNDELAVIGHDLSLSTAAHNSARFPFVSPPGMWKHDGKIAGRLQDGGLFENYGAETALEILDLACKKFACPDADEDMKKNLLNIVPIVILITSDPSLPANLAESPRHYTPVDFGYEIRSTFAAYEQVRSGRGAEAAYRLQQWTDATSGKGKVFTFRMCKNRSTVGHPPLGWALSKAAQLRIKGYLIDDAHTSTEDPLCYHSNATQHQQLLQLLSTNNP